MPTACNRDFVLVVVVVSGARRRWWRMLAGAIEDLHGSAPGNLWPARGQAPRGSHQRSSPGWPRR